MSQSLCLYDEGEEDWLVKIHAGCGGVYLSGYLNLDIEGKLAALNPSLCDANTTIISDYYARLDGDPNHLPTRREPIVDWIHDVTYLPYEENTIDKLVAIQVFEHLTPVVAAKTLRHWQTIMKPGRPLVMSVPDMEGTLDMLATDFDFAVRHLRGRRGNHYNSHHAWYTADTLCELLDFYGFVPHLLPNFHFYSAVVVRAIKR